MTPEEWKRFQDQYAPQITAARDRYMKELKRVVQIPHVDAVLRPVFEAALPAATGRSQELLDAEFWKRMRSLSVDAMMQECIRHYGADRCVTLHIHGMPRDEADLAKLDFVINQISKLRREFKSGGGGSGKDGTHHAMFAPLEDMDGLAAAIGFGEVTKVDRARRIISVQVDVATLPERSAPGSRIREDLSTWGGPRTGDDQASGIRRGVHPQGHAPDHPDSTAQDLAEILGGESASRREAVDRLSNADPTRVASPELRKQFAQALRQVAFDDRTDSLTRSKAVRGLVTWGGKYSVPLLIELLDADEPPPLRYACYQALAELKDQRAIEPVAARLASGHLDAREAAECLEAFGPRAEDAVLKLFPPDGFMQGREMVTLLGKIGTKKSLRPLQALRNERDYFIIRREVEQAVQAIVERNREAGQ
jgi:hypothetical protein